MCNLIRCSSFFFGNQHSLAPWPPLCSCSVSLAFGDLSMELACIHGAVMSWLHRGIGSIWTVAAAPPRLPSNMWTTRETSEDWYDTKDMDYEQLNHQQRIKYLVPRYGGYPDVSYFEKLPPDFQLTDNKSKDRYSKAVEEAESAIETFFDNFERVEKQRESSPRDDDSDYESDYSSDGCMIVGTRPKSYKWGSNGGWLSRKLALKFVRSLPKNLIFTASFEATGRYRAQMELCHCPCSTRVSVEL